MKKSNLEKIVSGFMILLMVVGIFIAVSNFTATSAYAKKKGGDDFNAKLECFDMELYIGCDCDTTKKVDCIIVHG